MQINWFTVIAQIFNFLILVWLMKRYLYKPILQAIDEREKKIAAEIKDAKTKQAEAEHEQSEYKKKNDSFDRHKTKMMATVAADGEKERQKLIDAAKAEAAQLQRKLEETSKELEESLIDQFAQKTQQEVLSITQKALAELASTHLEEQTVHVFIRNIKAINEKDKKQFIDAFQSDSVPLSIKSAFDLPEKDKKQIKTAISGLLGTGAGYAFETDPKMISGIELMTKGYKLSWSFAAYLSSLEKNMIASTRAPLKTVKK